MLNPIKIFPLQICEFFEAATAQKQTSDQKIIIHIFAIKNIGVCDFIWQILLTKTKSKSGIYFS